MNLDNPLFLYPFMFTHGLGFYFLVTGNLKIGIGLVILAFVGVVILNENPELLSHKKEKNEN